MDASVQNVSPSTICTLGPEIEQASVFMPVGRIRREDLPKHTVLYSGQQAWRQQVEIDLVDQSHKGSSPSQMALESAIINFLFSQLHTRHFLAPL
jgi:hypothetical protein